MKKPVVWTFIAAGTLVLAGCISNNETVYRDVERVPVEFENETAGRIFYEALSKSPPSYNHQESTTQVSIPVIFEHKRRIITGNNAAFNAGVNECDTNKDGKITEVEAPIFASQRVK